MAMKILKAGLSPLGAILGLDISGTKKSTPAATPAATAGPRVMPLADGGAVMAARKKSIAAQMARGGRSSTMLTSDSDTLGG